MCNRRFFTIATVLFTTLKGGIVIVVDGQVVGGIGVGGAKGEQDAEIARAGLAALLAAVKDSSGDSK